VGVYLCVLVASAGLVMTVRRFRATGEGFGPGPRSVLSVLVAATAGAVAAPAVLLVASWLFTPVYVPRYVLVSIPLAALAVAALMRLSRHHVLLSALVAVLGLVGLPQVLSGPQDRGENLAAAAAHVLSASRPGDCIVYTPTWSRPGLDYYLHRLDPAGTRVLTDAAVAAGGASAVAVADMFPREGSLGTVTETLRSCPRLWVAGYGGPTEWRPTPETGSAALEAIRPDRSVSNRSTFGAFEVELWVTPATT